MNHIEGVGDCSVRSLNTITPQNSLIPEQSSLILHLVLTTNY